MAYFAGVDLGATNVRAVVAAEDDVLGRASGSTPPGPRGVDVTEAVLAVLRAACDDGGVDPAEIAAVGVGSIGPLDLADGAVIDPANVPESVDRIPLTGPIGDLCETDAVSLHNDASAGVIGERAAHAPTPDDMVYLTISSGIGAGVCVDGAVLGGWDGNAGEVGHLSVDPAGRMPCGCGHDGHWEAYCAGDNLPAYARELHDDDPVETALPLADPEFSARDIYELAPEDEFAARVVEAVSRWNAIGVATVVHAYAPIVVVVGGGVAINNPDLVVDPIRERLPELVMSNVPEVKLTDLGEDAVVMGALASARSG